MKMTKVAVNYGETLNIGNYESRRVDFYAEAEIEGKEDANVVRRTLLLNLRDEVKQAADRIMAADRH